MEVETDKKKTEEGKDNPSSEKIRKKYYLLPDWQKYLITSILNIIISIGITVFIMTNYFIRPIAVVDIKSIIDNERRNIVLSKDISDDKKIEEIAKRIEKIGYIISQKKEIILVKDAVINYDVLKDYTNEIRHAIKDKKQD